MENLSNCALGTIATLFTFKKVSSDGYLSSKQLSASRIAFKTPSTNTIDLGDCNPKAVADVIHYSMTNDIPSIEDREGEGNRKHNDNAVRLYTQAWIVADRFNLERVANGLINRIAEYSDIWALNPSVVTTLVEADHGDSKLCNFMVRDIAYQIREQSYVGDENDWSFRTAEVEDSSSLQYESFEAVCQNMPSSILARIIRETQAAKECPTQAAIRNPCMLHTHELTDPCSPPVPDDSNEDDDEDSD